MEDKIYEMQDDYHQAQSQLLKLTAARDMLTASLETAHPSKLAKGLWLLAEANARIEDCTATLAAEYDAHQATEKSREVYDQKMSEMEEGYEAAMAYLAADHPEIHKRLLAQFNEEEN